MHACRSQCRFPIAPPHVYNHPLMSCPNLLRPPSSPSPHRGCAAARKTNHSACVIVLIILCLGLTVVPTAVAHARLVKVEPARQAEVTAPRQIELWFNELLEEGFNTVTIFPASELSAAGKHTDFAAGKPVLDAKDRTHLTVKAGTLPPGDYVIEWRVLSRDGHSAPGRSTFRVRAK